MRMSHFKVMPENGGLGIAGLLISLQRLSLTLDKMGETNESIISYEDLLSTALGESGLNLDDLFGNVPGNVLSQATRHLTYVK